MVDVAAQHGYGNTSVAAVIGRAEVARATFYAHFLDVDDCFAAALTQIGNEVLTDVEKAVGSAKPNDVPQAAIEALISLAVSDQSAARLLFIESLAAGPRTLGLRDEFCDRTAAAIEAAWANRVVKDGVWAIPADRLVGGVFRLLAMRLRHGESGLEGMPGELVAWADSYKTPVGPNTSQEAWSSLDRDGPRSRSATTTSAPGPLPADRHRLKRAEGARDQRERILAATTHLGYEAGFGKLTVTDITAAARVSRKAFYSHFHNKQQPAIEALEQFFEQAMAACAAAFFAVQKWRERVWEGGRALTEFITADPQNACLAFVEVHPIGEAAIQLVYSRLMAFTLFLEEGYSYRPEAGKVPRLSSEALAAVMFELCYRELREHRAADRLPSLLPELVYLCLAPFMGPEQATDFVRAKSDRRIAEPRR